MVKLIPPGTYSRKTLPPVSKEAQEILDRAKASALTTTASQTNSGTAIPSREATPRAIGFRLIGETSKGFRLTGKRAPGLHLPD